MSSSIDSHLTDDAKHTYYINHMHNATLKVNEQVFNKEKSITIIPGYSLRLTPE